LHPYNPVIDEIIDVLPAPFGPKSPNISPLSMHKLKLFTATFFLPQQNQFIVFF
jgi:hypothetical protein